MRHAGLQGQRKRLGIHVGDHATCHTGRRSCFYRTVETTTEGIRLRDDGSMPIFDSSTVYPTE